MSGRTWIRQAAALGAVALMLTACGRSDEGSDDAAASDVVSLSAGPATGDITIWAMGTEGEKLPAIADAFNAANPDANVTITAVPWDDAPTKISTAITSGKTPDATLLNPSALASFVATGGFAAVPEGVVDATTLDAGAYESTLIDGTSYSVPLYVDTRTLFFRKDLAEQAGVEVPQAWADYPAFAAALEGAGAKDGLLLPTGELGFTEQVLIPFIWNAGGAITDDEQSKFTLDTPEVVEGLATYQSMFTSGAASETGTYEPWGSVEERLASAEIGSTIEGPWMVPTLKEILGDEYESKIGVATIPSGSVNGQSWLDGGQLAVFRDAKNPEGAWKFIKYLSEPEQAAAFSKATGDLPAVSAAWEPAGLTADPTTAVFSEQLEETGSAPAIATWNQVASILAGYGEKLARGTVTPEEAAEQMQSELSGVGLD
jgi:multiple sugar transport system substrate-binding protein